MADFAVALKVKLAFRSEPHDVAYQVALLKYFQFLGSSQLGISKAILKDAVNFELEEVVPWVLSNQSRENLENFGFVQSLVNL